MEWRNDMGDKLRAEAGPGEWQDEPDKIHWIDEATALDCLMVRNRFGAWCGYVGVPPGHKGHGRSYSDAPGDIWVHGGLTYAAECQPEGGDNEGICHVPEPGRPDNLWWFGFDCAHFMDYRPGMAVRMREADKIAQERGMDPMPAGLIDEGVYRNRAYVEAEVSSLAKQLDLK